MEPLQGEGRPGTVPNEPFHACTVVALDPDRSVDAEPTGSLPAQHAVSVGFVEEALAPKVPEHAALEGTACPLQAVALELEPAVGVEAGGLMEADLTVGALRERAVEDDTVVVKMRVERRAEPMQKADPAELGIPGRAGTHAAKRRPDSPQEDPKDGTCDVRVALQEGP